MPFRSSLLAAGLAVATVVSGCVGQIKSDFPVVVVNKIANTLQVLVNGAEIGQVAAGQTGTFNINLPQTNPNQFINGVAPTPEATVTFSAKDLKTGSTSDVKNLTLSQNTPTYVTFTATDFARSVQPIARFTNSPTVPGVNEDISFSATASVVTNGTFGWDFGDNTTGTGVTVIHQYSRAATFTVTLTVTSETGQTATTSRTINVTAALPPTAAQFIFSPATPGVNQPVIFTAVTAAAVGFTFTWDFGDGSPPGSGASVTHTFARAGTYNVGLRVTNGGGQTATSARTVTASATSPQVIASFTFSPTQPGLNQDVFFNAIASMPSSGTFAWSFGDGSRGSGVNPTHQYAASGTYTVTLTVTNDIGQSNTTTRNVTVSATSPQVVANFTFSPVTPGTSQDVSFNAISSTPSNGTFTWDFGDGTRGTGVSTTHQYAQASTYTVSLTVTNSVGQSNTTSKTITVSATSTQVVANFVFSPTTPGTNQDVFFNAISSTPTTGTFIWDFGDGTRGTGLSPTHQFTTGGTFTVTLLLTSGAQSSTISKTITVTAPAISASFIFSPTDPGIAAGTNAVNFDATGSSSGVTTWTWDFGDGTTGTGQKLSHTFTKAGTWVVRLTVTDSAGRAATTTNSVTVKS
jgi:PKD repeat protein